MNAQLKPRPIQAPSAVTCSLVTQLIERDAFGQRKYGTSMDRKDLSIEDWLQHGTEEALDMAGYLTAAKREVGQLREQLEQAQVAAREYALLRRDLEQLIRTAEGVQRYNEGQNYQAGYREVLGRIKDCVLRHDSAAIIRQLRRKA